MPYSGNARKKRRRARACGSSFLFHDYCILLCYTNVDALACSFFLVRSGHARSP